MFTKSDQSNGPGYILESRGNTNLARASIYNSDGTFVGTCATTMVGTKNNLVLSGCMNSSLPIRCYDLGKLLKKNKCKCPPGYLPGGEQV